MTTPEAEALAYRDQVNWRSVTRADPSVQQIINTSTYCSVFVWDKVKDEWVKQKQEGPLFFVRRNKEPEYGLYMLNRASVKNPMWALVPNEMRVTRTDDPMLIVERRGEGKKTGIHFGEGKEKIEEFRASIVSICGEPSAKAGSAPPTLTQTQPQPQARPQPLTQPQQRALAQNTPSSSAPPVDDFARLFSGILPASSSSSRPPSTSINLPAKQVVHSNGNGNNWETKVTSTSTSRPDENTYTHTRQTTTTYTSQRPATPPSPPITFSELPISPSKSPVNLHPPGQTVADLLNSIGGGFSFPTPGPPPPPHMTAPAPPPVPAHPLLSPAHHTPQPIYAPTPPPSVPVHPLLSPQPPPAPSHPLLPPTNHIPPQAMRTPPPPPPQVNGPASIVPHQQRPRERPPHLDAHIPPVAYGQNPSVPPGVGQIHSAILDTLPTTYQPAGPDQRGAFQRDLIDMLQRDPIFVDQLFQAYLARRR